MGDKYGMSPLRGLSNRQGENHCFLNAVIQSLWNVHTFRANFLSFPHVCSLSHCIVCTLKSLFYHYQFSDSAVLPPDSVRQALSRSFHDSGRYRLGEMEDADETLETILSVIHSSHISASATAGVPGCCNSVSPSAKRVSPCIAHNVFGMKFCDVRRCWKCGRVEVLNRQSVFVYRVYVEDLRSVRTPSRKSRYKSLLTRGNPESKNLSLSECIRYIARREVHDLVYSSTGSPSMNLEEDLQSDFGDGTPHCFEQNVPIKIQNFTGIGDSVYPIPQSGASEQKISNKCQKTKSCESHGVPMQGDCTAREDPRNPPCILAGETASPHSLANEANETQKASQTEPDRQTEKGSVKNDRQNQSNHANINGTKRAESAKKESITDWLDRHAQEKNYSQHTKSELNRQKLTEKRNDDKNSDKVIRKGKTNDPKSAELVTEQIDGKKHSQNDRLINSQENAHNGAPFSPKSAPKKSFAKKIISKLKPRLFSSPDSSCRVCESSNLSRERIMTKKPKVFTLSFVWPTPDAAPQDIADLLAKLTGTLDLNKLFGKRSRRISLTSNESTDISSFEEDDIGGEDREVGEGDRTSAFPLDLSPRGEKETNITKNEKSNSINRAPINSQKNPLINSQKNPPIKNPKNEIAEEISSEGDPVAPVGYLSKSVHDTVGVTRNGEKNNLGQISEKNKASINAKKNSSRNAEEKDAPHSQYYQAAPQKTTNPSQCDYASAKKTNKFTSSPYKKANEKPSAHIRSHVFRGMICFYGCHYVVFFYHWLIGRWILMDDSEIKMGLSWNEVVAMCVEGRLLPCILYYERVDFSDDEYLMEDISLICAEMEYESRRRTLARK